MTIANSKLGYLLCPSDKEGFQRLRKSVQGLKRRQGVRVFPVRIWESPQVGYQYELFTDKEEELASK